jgi:nucleotide-binding universal stress UspA family protein
MIPPRVILAPVDFSEASRRALSCAARLARLWHAELHVLHAVDPFLAAAAHAAHLDLIAGTRDDLTAFTASAGPAGERAPLHHVVIGPAAEAICAAAADQRADLIVAGARGLSGVDRVMMGTTIERVIRRGKTPVLAIPGRPPLDDVAFSPVIAAVENPAEPGGVIGAATALADSLSAPLHVVHVVPPLPVLARWQQAAATAVERRVEDARRELAASLDAHQPPVAAQIHVLSGAVADALVDTATRHGGSTPMLVLGGAAGGRGPTLGSVASRVIAHASGPVLVYRDAP